MDKQQYPIKDPSELSVAEQVMSEKSPKSSKWRDRLSTFFLIIGAFSVAVMLNTFVFQSYEVDGKSMVPTLQDKDRLIIYKLDRTLASIRNNPYIPERGDIVVFHKPNGTSDQLIKRVIGLPGERVVVNNDRVTVYNNEFPEGFNPDQADWGLELPPTAGNVDVIVGSSEVFVCGDNRTAGASLDSRSVLGNVPLEKIVGKLVLRYIPLGNYRAF